MLRLLRRTFMTIFRIMMFIGSGFLVAMSVQPAWAQQPASAASQGQICDNGDPWNPSLCQGRTRLDERVGTSGYMSPGPIGPVERATLPPNSDSVIALVPDTLVQASASQNAPPMWMRVCRTNTASGGQNMFVTADGETIRLVYPRCTYIAFRRKVSIGTTANDQATTEYQMLGRY
jgi:hypothetical protein